jgi:hypothetical protein
MTGLATMQAEKAEDIQPGWSPVGLLIAGRPGQNG